MEGDVEGNVKVRRGDNDAEMWEGDGGGVRGLCGVVHEGDGDDVNA